MNSRSLQRHQRSFSLTATLALICLCVAVAPRVAGAEAGPADPLPQWIPSVWTGLGTSIREIDGDAYGTVDSSTTNSKPGVNDSTVAICFDLRCTFDTADKESIGFMTVPVGGQLLGPTFDSLPWRPRPLIHGGISFPLKSSRQVTRVGFKPSDFGANIGGMEPKVRIKLSSETQHNWFIGLGSAFELPIDMDPERRVWLKLSVNYSREKAESVAKIMQSTEVTGGSGMQIIESKSKSEMVDIDSVGPGIGIEALVFKAGPIGIGFGADFMVNFALNNDTTTMIVEAPGKANRPEPNSPVEFNYTPDSMQWQGLISFRFSWLGY